MCSHVAFTLKKIYNHCQVIAALKTKKKNIVHKCNLSSEQVLLEILYKLPSTWVLFIMGIIQC